MKKLKKTIKKNKTPDAAESNAGDDFHVLWTIRKCLDLLKPKDSELELIAIEGLTKLDEAIIDTDGDSLLGVDLTEYFGGGTFKLANKVVISQLKYSTRHSSVNWTVSKICTGKKGDTKGSIVERLAAFYKKACANRDTKDHLNKLQIKLVSNRPASIEILDLISKVQTELQESKKAVSLKGLKTGLSPKENKLIDQLLAASKLTNKRFIEFLRILDFTDCSAKSRFLQKQELIKAISELGTAESKTELAKLRELIWAKMMPESKGINTIIKDDILLSLGVSDISDLFPAPSKFENLKNIVVREQIPAIIEKIKDLKNPKLCVHAGAGMGKSTLVNMISVKLPQKSICIKFDCYGGGSYLDPEDKRHKHRNAFTQLSNELAMQIGTPFLLSNKLSDDIYIKEFRKRLDKANSIVEKLSANALVVLIIDAADNASTAANNNHEKCFVHDIVRMALPSRVRLIVTSRTERVNLLRLDSDIKKIEIDAFSMTETSSYLTKNFSKVAINEVREFRKLTKATPRVMSYVLGIPDLNLSEKLKSLKPDGKNIDQIFRLHIQGAEKKTGNKKELTEFLTYLISLPRPIPLQHLQKISGVSATFIEDIGVDLWHGLIYENDTFSFRDEDFENYLKATYKYTAADINTICTYFLNEAENDEYSSIHLGTFLSLANKKGELLKIVLDRKYLQHPIDPIKNKEVYIERTRLAMQLCASDTGNLDFLKLQMLAAETSKTNRVLEQVLINNSELAASYGNLQTNQKLFFQAGNPEWFGRVHFRSAAFFSRNKETLDLAQEHLTKAENWLKYRNHLSEDNKGKYLISETDIASGAEAILRLYGVNECLKWINGWQPRSIIYEVFEVLFSKLIVNSNTKEIESWLKSTSLQTDTSLQIIQIALKNGLNVRIDTKQFIVAIKRFVTKTNITVPLQSSLISFCEYALKTGINYSDIKPIVDFVQVPVPDRVPSFYDHYGLNDSRMNMDILIRKMSIKKLCENSESKVEFLYPKRITDALANPDPKAKAKIEDDKKKMDTLYKHLIPIYELKLKCLLNKLSKKAIEKEVDGILSEINRDYDFSYTFGYEYQFINAFINSLLTDVVFITRIETLLVKIKKPLALKDRNNLSLYTSIARRLSVSDKFQMQVLDILAEIDNIIEADNLPGSEQIDHYINCAIIGSTISKETGKFYFDKMVQRSSEVDLEAYDQIRCIYDLLSAEKPMSNPKLAYDFARYVEFCKIRLGGYDNFPWFAAIEALKQLDLPSLYSILCRWDHRDIAEIQDHLITTVRTSLERNLIDTATATSFLPLNQYREGFDELISLINHRLDKEDSSMREAITDEIIRDVKIQYNGSSELLGTIIEKNKNESTLEIKMNKLIAYKKGIDSFRDKEPKTTKYKEDSTISKQREKVYSKIVQKVDFCNYLEIERGLQKAGKGTSNGFVNEELFFNHLKKKVKLQDQGKFLNALIALSADSLRYWSFEKVLGETLIEWKSNPAVKLWKKGKFIQIIKTHFNHFIEYEQVGIKSLKDLATLLEVDDAELKNSMLQLLPDHLNEFSPAILYQFFNITTVGISTSDKLKLIEWILPKWANKIKKDFGDGVFNKDLIPPKDSKKVIAGFFRYTLGHPDKRIRWRTSHALRKLGKLNESSVLSELLADQNKPSCFPFQDQSYPYYWMAAKGQLWITIDRISRENPNILFKLSKTFVCELANIDLPHAQVNYFIKSTCTQLLKANDKLFTKNEKEVIAKALVSMKGKSPTKRTYPRQGGRHLGESKTVFSFDSMDTLPYWYEPLGSVFDVGASTVASIADSYITKKWGYTNDTVKKYRVNNRDWGLTMHRHGSEPTIETFSTYLEYHAMFCAAGELLKTKPVVENDDWYGGWDDWIEGWANCWKDYWLADFRDPLPVEKRYRLNKRTEKDWKWGIERKDFDICLGLNELANNEYLIVYSHNAIHYGKDYETNSVSSALVNPKTANSLLLTLQTSNKYEFHLPLEKDPDRGDNTESSHYEFKLEGWIRNISTQREGIDDRDELYNDIYKAKFILGDKFTNWSGVTITSDYRYSIRDHSQEKITIFENWSNDIKENHYGGFTSSGYRLLLKKKELLGFLKHENKCLIVSCELSRRVDRESREFVGDFDDTYTLIYLIHPSGQIETISGSSKLR